MNDYVITMTEKKGHFEQGRWVEETIPASPGANTSDMDRRLADATKSVITSIDEMITVTRDLVTTKEGQKYVEKTLTDTRKEVEKSFDSILRQVKSELDKHVKR